MANKTYTATRAILFGKKRYEAGDDIELPEDVARQLLAGGSVTDPDSVSEVEVAADTAGNAAEVKKALAELETMRETAAEELKQAKADRARAAEELDAAEADRAKAADELATAERVRKRAEAAAVKNPETAGKDAKPKGGKKS